jgi:hypothetical protein
MADVRLLALGLAVRAVAVACAGTPTGTAVGGAAGGEASRGPWSEASRGGGGFGAGASAGAGADGAEGCRRRARELAYWMWVDHGLMRGHGRACSLTHG